ncbi:MAG: hypothetical protein MR364_05720 [Oscillospiraceae bacterium]|nr:hypothetical protein [Oscillospiraceae bacterium]
MKQGNNKSFLRNGIILLAALALICVFMPEWGAAQVLVVILVALLAGFQWFLYFYMRNK